jgi:hypothetical protein
MSSSPVQEGSFIYLGTTRAVVSCVHSPERVEVVYRNSSGRHVAEDAVFDSNAWRFASQAVGATYADRSPRLQHFIAMLTTPNPN